MPWALWATASTLSRWAPAPGRREEASSLLPGAGAHRERVEAVAQRAQGIVEQVLEGL